MSFKIFYSWQSKTPNKYNWSFIEDCLKNAVKQLKKQLINNSPEFYIDRDTKDVSGIPNIPVTLEDKIKLCDVFVADLTFINSTLNPPIKPNFFHKLFGITPKPPQFLINEIKEGISASNVLQELGIALGSTPSSERIVTVINTAFGDPSKLNFDLTQRRFPIKYNYYENTAEEEKKKQKQFLIDALKSRIGEILSTEHERQKEYFIPFCTWKSWQKVLIQTFSFEATAYLSNIFDIIHEKIDYPKKVFRLCGLSGIGKTRMIFECFNYENGLCSSERTNKILYVDLNENEEKEILKTINNFVSIKENKIIVVDNCSKELHSRLASLIASTDNKLSLLTISTDPDERANQLEIEGITEMIILDNQSCKETVDKILVNNFAEFEKQEQDLLVEFSSGIAFVATLMATNQDRGRHQPGTLTKEEVVTRLLGPLYTNKTDRAVIYACSLFSRFGFYDDLKHQAEKIALCKDLFAVDETGINEADIDEWRKLKFQEVCSRMEQRQLLEKKGRTFAFRPSPLAVRMAEDWWRDCTVKKFERILPLLREADLVESFCEQFRYLNHVENAKAIVKNLCDGFFSLAEVLNTAVGSRLFRSFVYVNPVACTEALTKAFMKLPLAEVEEMTQGRRNLVWALEKLCFRAETFFKATKVMASLAVAENENIGNNATNQFLQLFHIYLPGTSATLEERWKIIEYCLAGNTDYVNLGIKALNSCLKSDSFHRMGGAEEQGDGALFSDYQPSPKEIQVYWTEAINKLEEYAINRSTESQISVKILFDHLYSLCAHGAGFLILPVFERIVETGLLDKIEARKQTQFILRSKRVFDNDSIERLQKIYDKLEPTSFEERFKLIVQSPSSDEYSFENGLDNGVKDYRSSIDKKINDIASEYLSQKYRWNDLTPLLVSESMAEGTYFGKALFCHLRSEDEENEILNLLVEGLKKISPEKRNISVLSGFLMAIKKSSKIAFFNSILKDNDLADFVFPLARVLDLPSLELNRLVEATQSGKFAIIQFSNFAYGWGLKHLTREEVISILNQLRLINNQGKAVAFFILAKWLHGDEGWNLFEDQIRIQLIEDSKFILENVKGSMDYYEWSHPLSKLLNNTHDVGLAEMSAHLIMEEMNVFEGYYSKETFFQNIADILQKKYFDIFWNELVRVYSSIDTYGMTVFHLKDLLGSRQDTYANTEGLLFKDDASKFNVVFNWCKEHQGREIHWVTQLLPVFDSSNKDHWHPYAKSFIDEFGENDSVLSGLSSKLGTYSWVGSVVPRLESHKTLFESLVNHPKEKVREWAQQHIEDLVRRIKWEANRDEEGL